MKRARTSQHCRDGLQQCILVYLAVCNRNKVITAGALIDGLPYKAGDAGDKNIQAGYFSDKLMIWPTDDQMTDYPFQSTSPGPRVVANVVGRVRALEIKDGKARVPVGTSPVDVLIEADYERLTR